MKRWRIERPLRWTTSTNIEPLGPLSQEALAKVMFTSPHAEGYEKVAVINVIRYLSTLGAGELHWKCSGDDQVYRFEQRDTRHCPRCRTACGSEPLRCQLGKLAMDKAMDSVVEF